MTATSVQDPYRNYRAPRDAKSKLVVPPIHEIVSRPSPFAFPPETQLGAHDIEFCGKSLQENRSQARLEALQLATEYTSSYSNADRFAKEDISEKQIFLSGHQPELFHAGVWFKNFLLARLGEETNAIAINFLVDNDLCRDTSLRIPVKSDDGAITLQQRYYDRWRAPIPWELRNLECEETWNAFLPTVRQDLASLGIQNSLLERLWPKTRDPLQRHGNIGLALAQARHELEREAGLNNLEVPLSRLVSTLSFARFSIQLLSCLPRFQQVYNEQREAYRAAHSIRSAAHPVPALEQTDGWLEGPWWVYRPESPQRKRLWVRLVDNQLILSDRSGWQTTIEGRLDCDNAAAQWLEILSDGICLRPRALLTTMYLRLFVGDWFLHGIGGGKYDQLTDRILEEYFGIAPPPYAVATATLRLPLSCDFPPSGGIESQIQQLKQSTWQQRFHGEQFATENDQELDHLVEQKNKLLENIPPRGEKWDWHQQMKRVNEQLAEKSKTHSKDTRAQTLQLQAQLKQAKIAESREYSFCLYPEDQIVPVLRELARP